LHRPGSLTRILDELADLASSSGDRVRGARTIRTHALAAGRLDGKGRVGEYLQSAEAARFAMRRGLRLPRARRWATFTIRPGHNPIGPFDFGGE